MARTVKSAALETRSARLRLPDLKKHWQPIEMGLHLGYRRGPRGGTWYARRFAAGRYRETTLGRADDATDADGFSILGFRHALAAARTWWQAEERRALGGPDSSNVGPYTVSAACDDYVAHYVRKGGKAEYDTRRVIEAHIRPALGSVPVAKLTTKLIRDWHHQLAAAAKRVRTRHNATQQATRGVNPDDSDAVRSRRATANRVLSVLKATLNHSWHERRVLSDDAWRPVTPFRGVDLPVIRYLNHDECRRLLNASPLGLRQLACGALLTGARFGELIRLRVCDVDLQARTLTIRASKGGKPRHAVLTDEACALFESLAAGKASSERLFLRSDGNEWRSAQPARPLREACKRAGIEPSIGFHVLRHTHASTLAMQGVPMGVIAAQLGHSDTRMTERHYAHLSPNYISDTIRSQFPRLGIVESTVHQLSRLR